MRVGIDIRKYHDYGIGTYIRNIVDEFQRRPDIDPVHFSSAVMKDDLSARMPKGEFVLDESPKYSIQELFSLSRKANVQRLDLYHAPHYTLPIGLRCPAVVTIHDIIHLRLKQYFSPVQRAYAYLMIRHACRAASAVIVDSQFGKEELLDVFHIPEKKIHVIHLGVNVQFFEQQTESVKTEFLQRCGIEKPFLLYTGSVKPHKNVMTLLRAFRMLRDRHDIQLVLTGEDLSSLPGATQFIRENGLEHSVCELGKVGFSDLRTCYQTSFAVVLPSLYEGFGFSMVEAMASGVPAVGARATSITEIVGDAGILFDPSSDTDLADRLHGLFVDPSLRAELIRKGSERARQFSWSKCIAETLDVYRKVLV